MGWQDRSSANGNNRQSGVLIVVFNIWLLSSNRKLEDIIDK
jgi:hypothetical protein